MGQIADPSILLAGLMDQLIAISRAVSCATRLRVLQRLGPNGMHLGEAAEAAGIAPSTASWHLGQLVAAGLAVRQRRGRRCKYTWGPLRWSLVCTGPLGSK